ncbi:RHE_PE00001 family protein [Rhizobium sp. BK376]|uniref:RHE_PE00001 family protein n=1 Tax=Rhizobium sp. BK376 TaxID=2512149 RepID=UPI001049ACD8|nr:RHE_PE00001 family protein [Rhizobium sp. BK376]
MRYDLSDLPLSELLPALSQAEDMLARLDERVLRHAVADGFKERGHFFDSVAALWVGGELVHVEDLVLHDAHMDARAPTHELTIAHAVLRARRRLWNAEPAWGISPAGIAAIRGGAEGADDVVVPRPPSLQTAEDAGEIGDEDEEEDSLAAEFAEIDAILARSERALEAGAGISESRSAATDVDPLGLVHDEEWDEEERLQAWRNVIRDADALPPSLGAAMLFDAWERIEPLRRQHWMGSLLVSAYLRSRGKVTSHLFSLNVGLKSIRHERRRSRDGTLRLLAFLDAMTQAADAGLKELDRLSLARSQMERRMKDRRSNSKLPGVIELILSRPIVSVNMVARHVNVTARGALNLVGELGVREMTGRGRYRGWGVL